MKRLLILAWTALIAAQAYAQYDVKPFEHLSVSVNAGTLGAGVQVAAPVSRLLSLRTGLMLFKYTYNYEYDGVIHYEHGNIDYDYEEVIPMTAKANMVNALLLADLFPFRNKIFHLTGGFYVGTPDIVKVSAEYAGRPIEIGDVVIDPGTKGARIAAQLETSGFKPYVGIGLGSSVAKRNRVGFKFELGAMFHGRPRIVVTEGNVLQQGDTPGLDVTEDLDRFNKLLANFSVYPVLNFQLHFRVF